jgi:uncharacterized protein (TIGR02453 family)
MTTIHPSTLDFLKDLAENNQREWFHKNKKRYDAAKKNVLEFTTEFLKAAIEIDPTLADLEPKKCIFRINRDVRFSKDKSPYKINMGISFNKGGKKKPTAGYYLNIEPNGTFMGGGNYMVQPEELKKIREEIDYNFSEFQGIITDKAFTDYYGEIAVEEKLSLKRPPKGYDADNPAVAWLKWKSFTAFGNYTNQAVTSDDFMEECLKGIFVLKPFVNFLNRGLDA